MRLRLCPFIIFFSGEIKDLRVDTSDHYRFNLGVRLIINLCVIKLVGNGKSIKTAKLPESTWGHDINLLSIWATADSNLSSFPPSTPLSSTRSPLVRYKRRTVLLRLIAYDGLTWWETVSSWSCAGYLWGPMVLCLPTYKMLGILDFLSSKLLVNYYLS